MLVAEKLTRSSAVVAKISPEINVVSRYNQYSEDPYQSCTKHGFECYELYNLPKQQVLEHYVSH